MLSLSYILAHENLHRAVLSATQPGYGLERSYDPLRVRGTHFANQCSQSGLRSKHLQPFHPWLVEV